MQGRYPEKPRQFYSRGLLLTEVLHALVALPLRLPAPLTSVVGEPGECFRLSIFAVSSFLPSSVLICVNALRYTVCSSFMCVVERVLQVGLLTSLMSKYSVRVARTCALKCDGSFLSRLRENLLDLKFCRPASAPRRLDG